jgi:hypothetical protein
MEFYCRGRSNNIDPLDFLADDDELYFITGRSEKARMITERWQKKYYPTAKLIITNNLIPGNDITITDWYVKQAHLKARAILDNKIDVYFEDTPEVVKLLREICQHTKVIKYGKR